MEADLTALRSKCDMLDRTITDESSTLLQISDDEKVTDRPPVQRESVTPFPIVSVLPQITDNDVGKPGSGRTVRKLRKRGI